MPRIRQSQGRPGTPVIPKDWQAGHAAVVAKTLKAKVRIGPPGGTTGWNEGRGQTETADAAAVYVGAASVMPVSDTNRILTVVEDPTSTRVYEVTLPLNEPGVDLVTSEHIVKVTACDDAQLVGKKLAIGGIERGSQRFSRVLLATLAD